MSDHDEGVLDPAFLSRVDDIIAGLTPVVSPVGGTDVQWIFYGSQVAGTSTSTSDLDVMALHDRPEVPPCRISASFGVVPVTVYALSRGDLLADGRDRSFGGYFALKLLEPFVCRPRTGDAVAMQALTHFLAPFTASWAPAAARTSDQLLADALLAFLRLYPDADGYVAAQLGRPDPGRSRWRRQARLLTDAYTSAGYLHRLGDDSYRYRPGVGLADPDRAAAAAAARFWAFGAVCHDADHTFPDRYRSKAESKAAGAQRRSVRDQLRSQPAGTAR